MGSSQNNRVLVVIPARIGSTRFPGKVLHKYRGRPLLYYVWSEAKKTRLVDRVVIATDSSEVNAAAKMFGAEVFLSKTRHLTGSDRVAEVAAKLGGGIIVDIQADNFGLKRGVLDRVIKAFIEDPKSEVGTMARRINNDADLLNTNIVKVVTNKLGRALWFSRLPIPFVRDSERRERCKQFVYREHIGVYLYRNKVLAAFGKLNRSEAEKAESLEQLRLLEHGFKIQVYETRADSVSVDSPDDLKKLDRLYN